jgi:hypothetical protein
MDIVGPRQPTDRHAGGRTPTWGARLGQLVQLVSSGRPRRVRSRL